MGPIKNIATFSNHQSKVTKKISIKIFNYFMASLMVNLNFKMSMVQRKESSLRLNAAVMSTQLATKSYSKGHFVFGYLGQVLS